MKTGDYARTKSGIIGKLIIKEDTIAVARWQGDYELQDTTSYTIGDTHFYKSDIIKSSPNIIDLIEVGDYVNGKLVSYIGSDCIEVYWYKDEMEWLEQEDIISIVTKEQFSQMEYKVE